MPHRARTPSRRAFLIAALALAVLVGVWALAPVALAGSLNNELAEKVQQQEAETPSTTTTTTTSSTSESGGSNTKTLVIVASAAGVVLAVIAFVIVRDARRVAPVTETQFGETALARHSAARLRRRRARAKAARKQRRRNR